jgi:hypothetical protein
VFAQCSGKLNIETLFNYELSSQSLVGDFRVSPVANYYCYDKSKFANRIKAHVTGKCTEIL